MDEYRVVIFLVSSLSIPKIDCCLKCHKSKLSQKKKKNLILYIDTHTKQSLSQVNLKMKIVKI